MLILYASETRGEIEASSREVSKLAAELTRSTEEQASAAANLAHEGEDVRRISRQTTRAIGEQAEAISSLANASVKQTGSLQRVALAMNEQTNSATEIVTAVTEIQMRTRELTSGIAQHARGVATVAANVDGFANQISKIRQANTEQAKKVESITEGLERRLHDKEGLQEGA